MTQEKSMRRRLQAVYGATVREVAKHLLHGNAPTTKQVKALVDYYRAKFYPNRSLTELPEEEILRVIWRVESHAAMKVGVSFQQRSSRA